MFRDAAELLFSALGFLHKVFLQRTALCARASEAALHTSDTGSFDATTSRAVRTACCFNLRPCPCDALLRAGVAC
jgi:hypothetical protein